MGHFVSSVRVVTGDAADAIASLSPRRLMMVADPFFDKSGVARELCRGIPQVEYFFGVEPDPSAELVAAGAKCLQKFDPDVVVALGGGSAMDCAKAMKYFAGSPAALVAVPTTSGSGSEVTGFAILTHGGVKHPLVDEALRPRMAVLDEKLVAGLPRSLAADTGFDALTHALEGYTATGHTGFSDALALEAFCRIFRLLPRSCAGDTGVRGAVHEAATMAAMAFDQAGLGLCHAMSHALGGRFHLPHGRLNAIVLPEVMSLNARSCDNRYAVLAAQLGLEARAAQQGARNLRFALIRLRKQLGLPDSLHSAGVSPQEVRRHRDTLTEAVLADPCCQTNPVPVTAEGVQALLDRVTGHG